MTIQQRLELYCKMRDIINAHLLKDGQGKVMYLPDCIFGFCDLIRSIGRYSILELPELYSHKPGPDAYLWFRICDWETRLIVIEQTIMDTLEKIEKEKAA